MERHAGPAWQSWGVISVCRLQEGVTGAQGEPSLSTGASTQLSAQGRKDGRVSQQGAQPLLGRQVT